MAYDPKKKQMKPSPTAPPGTKTFGPNGSFRGGDIVHDRLAISGATRSRRAGHISPTTAASIQSKARADLDRLEGKKPRFAAPKKTSPPAKKR